MKLVTISFSHYCDKARWALEHYGVPYVESGYMPLFHMPGVLWATKLRVGSSDAASSPMSTPILITDGGAIVRDSGVITRWASDNYGNERTTLYPAEFTEAIATVERELHDRLGPHTRRWGYNAILEAPPATMAHLVASNATSIQRRLFMAGRPAWVAALRRVLKIDPERAARSLQIVREVFDAYAPRLSGRRFMFGERFTAADLSLATMAAPVLGVSRADGYGAELFEPSMLEPEAAGVVEAMRQTPVGQFVLRVYREQRAGLSPQPAAPVVH